MTTCAQPGCDGTIADDGYCDECGRAATPGPAVAVTAGPSGSSGSPGPSATLSAMPSGPPTAASGPAAPPPSTPTSGPTSTPTSGPVSGPMSGSGRSASGRTGSGRSRSTSSRRHIGAGLVEITATRQGDRLDPAEVVMADPQVPERHRYCGRCEAPVGRSRGDRPGRAQGFCPTCGTAFSFVPTLATGDVVAGQYEVLGCLAHGGLGWIYLALDRAVDDRWVVLKGLIDTGDEAALAAAIAERGFLARLQHPRIVRIYNMVTAGTDGYIVMEYVDGRSLRQMRDPRTPMPPDQAIAYLLEVLPALAHMHDEDLLYCDFKPDNVVQTGTEVKLIDLGAVRRMDEPGGDVWGTVGYQAPEIRPDGPGPSIASDVYTVGRALAVLVTNFDFSRRYVDRLPDAVDAPVLAEHDGLRRLLARATDHDPARRFASIGELAEQMTGVLRQVVAAHSPAPPPPRPSAVFGPPRRAVGTVVDAPPDLAALPAALPTPLVDADDPAAPVLAPVGAAPAAEKLAALDEVARMGLDTEESRRLTVLARAESGDLDAARAARDTHHVDGDPGWAWADAVLAAAKGDVEETHRAAEAVVDALPGELTAWLLAAVAAEQHGDPGALSRYERVWRTDHGWIDAAFGLARTRLAGGDRAGALAALDEVPATSVHHVDAQVAAVRLALGDATPDHDALVDAGRRCERLDLDVVRRAELECEVLEAARDRLRDGAPGGGTGGDLLGCPLDERGLGFGLESRYRTRARYAPDLTTRIALVDRANDARPWTRV